jgi:hypothetical protein
MAGLQSFVQHPRSWLVPLKATGLLGASALMLGAHYSHPPLRSPGRSEQSATSSVEILAGHADAITISRWSPERTFRRVTVKEWGRQAALDSAQLATILKINRVDQRHARRGTLLVPDSIAAELSYSPLPESLPEFRGIPKFVVVSRRVQAFGAYEDGVLVRWGPTSTGKAATPTDSGLFFTNWKARQAISTDDPTWVLDWYVNFIAQKGVAFHEYSLPGAPASHGCVRLLEDDAKWMYRWTEQWIPGRGSAVKRYGTPVLVTGDYDYSAPAPWLALAEDPTADRVTAVELEVALLPYLERLIPHGGQAPPSLALQTGAFSGS